MKKIRLCFLFLIFCNLFSSCVHDTSIDFEITSPKSDWTYYTDKNITFSSNLNSKNFLWKSSIDGELGEGAVITNKLSEGLHTISLIYIPTKQEKQVRINVQQRKDQSKKTTLLQESTKNNLIQIHEKNTGIFSIDGNIKKFKTNTISKELMERKSKSENIRKIRDLNIHINGNSKNYKIASQKNRSSLNENNPKDAQSREFYVMNTITQMDAHIVNAKLLKETEFFFIYVDEETNIEKNDEILVCSDCLEKTVFPRVISLWGKCEDIDENNKITLLFTPKINTEGVAVGFFNQNDFFANDKTDGENSKNRFSNEMDILYITIPDESNYNYSIPSICATVGHELAHAINFSNKTYAKVKAGEQEPKVMQSFLDEGLSHLTESLIGLGETGGNQKFVERYLSNSAFYSFCDYDSFGSSDTVYQRGAMALFLYYLFQKAGGYSWDESGKNFIDTGGITFIRKIITDNDFDWPSIGNAFGKETNILFKEFAEDLLTKNISEIIDVNLTDPFTNEKIFYCENLLPYSSFDEFNFVNHSIIKFSDKNILYDYDLKITWESITGNIYLVEE